MLKGQGLNSTIDVKGLRVNGNFVINNDPKFNAQGIQKKRNSTEVNMTYCCIERSCVKLGDQQHTAQIATTLFLFK